jgi:tRNA (guanine37-N1)-methyltransferase
LFRPPIQRSAAAVLDRALFSKTIPIAAARVTDRKHISRCRTQLDKSRELLHLERLTVVRDDPDPILATNGGKCLLLKPEVKPDGALYILSIFFSPS